MEQHENKESFYHLILVCRLVAGNFGNPEIASWTNGDYLRLSSILSRHAEIQLSPSTLKRIFGKLKTPERYYPQKATRDGLARYAGFKDWDDFVEKNVRPAPANDTTDDEAAVPAVKIVQQPAPHISWWPAVVLMLGACGIFGWQWWKHHKERNMQAGNGTRLVCNNPVGDNPHSAVFRLQLPASFHGDSSGFEIAFGDGEANQPIRPGAVLTHYYEKPGRFYTRLLYHSQPTDTIPIYLKTDGWEATAYSDKDTTRVYPLPAPVFAGEGMTVTPAALHAAGIDTLHTFYVDFVNTQEWDVTGDDIDFTAKLTTSGIRPGVRCSQVMITLFGERASHEILLLKPGCVSWSHLRFAEELIDGAEEDLSALGTDLTTGGEVHLRIGGCHAAITVNGKPLYEMTYRQPIGQLYGVKISFAGTGTVRQMVLRQPDGTLIFKDGAE